MFMIIELRPEAGGMGERSEPFQSFGPFSTKEEAQEKSKSLQLEIEGKKNLRAKELELESSEGGNHDYHFYRMNAEGLYRKYVVIPIITT